MNNGFKMPCCARIHCIISHLLSTGVPIALQMIRPNCPEPSSVRTASTQCSPDAAIPIRYFICLMKCCKIPQIFVIKLNTSEKYIITI